MSIESRESWKFANVTGLPDDGGQEQPLDRRDDDVAVEEARERNFGNEDHT